MEGEKGGKKRRKERKTTTSPCLLSHDQVPLADGKRVDRKEEKNPDPSLARALFLQDADARKEEKRRWEGRGKKNGYVYLVTPPRQKKSHKRGK